ncbi:MAG: AAA family ATPase, partial [Lentisphaeria bacterium]|nr:AAA family ATPase [Lentisphaeria bacterium]
HIHRPQAVPGCENWRYAGSLLKMQLRKNPYAPQVFLLDTCDLSSPRGIEIPDECFHKMAVIEGDMDLLNARLTELADRGAPVWVKPVFTGERGVPNWQIDLLQKMRNSCVTIVRPEVRRKKTPGTDEAQTAADRPLSESTPEQIFLETIAKDEFPEERKNALLKLYRKAQNAVCDPSELTEKTARQGTGAVMKFKRLRLKNINSLYGENVIDFEDPAFGNGIFLISGDTGAGKSSILDGICLALYGCTPRAEKPTKERDDIISHGADELLAELTFSLGPKEYRARFSHVRTSRSDAKKSFRDCEQTLCCDGRETAGGKKDFRSEIISLIGMDMKQFTQCVLLAQGSFDAFLKARTNDRAAILSSITGTEIYGRIGDRINKEYLAADANYKALEKQIATAECLPEEERRQFENRRRDASEELAELNLTLRELERCRQIFSDIRSGEEKVREAGKKLEFLHKEEQEASPLRARLADAERARNCVPAFGTCKQARKEAADAEKALAELDRAHIALQKAAQVSADAKKRADENLKKVVAEQVEKQGVFTEIRRLDTLRGEKTRSLDQAQKELAAAERTQGDHRRQFEQAEESWKKLQESSAAAGTYLALHEADRQLETSRAAWEERRQALVKMEADGRAEQEKADTMRRELVQALKKLGPLQKREKEAEKALSDHAEQLKNAEEEKKRLLDGHTREAITEELHRTIASQAFYERAANYEEDRKNLRPGDKCPLCGSVEHPLCSAGEIRANMHEQDITRLKTILEKLDGQEKFLQTRAVRSAELEKELADCRNSRENQQNEIARRKSELEQFEEQLGRKTAETAVAAAKLAEELRQALQTVWLDHSALPPELDTRISALKSALAVSEKLEAGRKDFENAKKTFEEFSAEDSRQLELRRRNREALRTELEALTRERTAKFSGDVEEAEKFLADRVSQARKALADSSERAVSDAAAVTSNRTGREALRGKLDKELLPALGAAEAAFADELTANGFADENAFTEKQMDLKERNRHEDRLRKLDEELAAGKAALEERKKFLEDKKKQLPENADEKRLCDEIAASETRKAGIEEDIRRCAVALDTDEKNRRKVADLLEEKRKMAEQQVSWAYLNERFGTDGGRRFSRIAQGYTFRNLVALANARRIGALRQHFTLVSSSNDPLELDVIDHYRGDVVRTAGNLSGGESFEVSLALALGLADMSSISQKASLGNVLLDEGFGTLDDRALASALDLLMDLRTTSGKLVGIISHVEKLKERIETRIDVSSQSGIGTLSGAGVSVPAPAAGPLRPNARRGRPKKLLPAADTAPDGQ